MDQLDYQTPAAPAPEPAPPRRFGGVLLLIGVAVLVLAGIGGALWYVRSRAAVAPTPPPPGTPVQATVTERDATAEEIERGGLLPGTKVRTTKTPYGETTVQVAPAGAEGNATPPTHPVAP